MFHMYIRVNPTKINMPIYIVPNLMLFVVSL